MRFGADGAVSESDMHWSGVGTGVAMGVSSDGASVQLSILLLAIKVKYVCPVVFT